MLLRDVNFKRTATNILLRIGYFFLLGFEFSMCVCVRVCATILGLDDLGH